MYTVIPSLLKTQSFRLCSLSAQTVSVVGFSGALHLIDGQRF